MKHRLAISTIFFFLLFSSQVFSQQSVYEEKFNTIEDNLLVGLKSDNTGLRVSCAYFLGEMRSNKAINDLLGMLKNSDLEEERIIAALSLSKIRSEQSIFAVKQRIKFDNSERVQRLCEIFYNNYLNNSISNDLFSEERSVDMNMTYNGKKLSQFASFK